MKGFRWWKPFHMSPENIDEGFAGVIGAALQGNLAIGMMQEGEHIQGTITDVLEFFEALSHGFSLKIGRKALEYLDAWTLIEENQMAGWISEKAKEVLHFRKEIGVGDVKEVARPVRLELIALQNAMQRRLAGRYAYFRGISLQIACSPSHRPSPAVGQRLGLAVESHNAQLDFRRVEGGVPRARPVVKVSCRFAPSNPTPHGLNRTLQGDRNGLELNMRVGQQDHRLSTRYFR